MSEEFVSATPVTGPTSSEFTSVDTEVRRDRWGRPYIKQVDGTEVAYTRCTTFIDVFFDKSNIVKWKQRLTALGIVDRPDLRLAVAAHRDDKKALNEYVEQAAEHAGISAKATKGTAIHKLTEYINRGEPLPDGLDAVELAMLEAYRKAMEPFKVKKVEQFVVNDRYQVGGTFDLLLQYKGELIIGDLKTGNIDLDTLKIAMQLAMYSRSKPYDIAKGIRMPWPGGKAVSMNFNRGIVIHLPQVERPEDAVCHVYWIDLEAGWSAVLLAKAVREARKQTFRELTQVFEGKPTRPSLRMEKKAEERAAAELAVKQDGIRRMIAASDTVEMVNGLWYRYEPLGEWNDELTAAAAARVAQLNTALPTA